MNLKLRLSQQMNNSNLCKTNTAVSTTQLPMYKHRHQHCIYILKIPNTGSHTKLPLFGHKEILQH